MLSAFIVEIWYGGLSIKGIRYSKKTIRVQWAFHFITAINFDDWVPILFPLHRSVPRVLESNAELCLPQNLVFFARSSKTRVSGSPSKWSS